MTTVSPRLTAMCCAEGASPRSQQKGVFDLKLNNRMAALQNYVAQGDYAPTEQQYSVFRELSSAIDSALARFVTLKSQLPSQ